jgi:putative ABC transport system substrate-binding protein
MKALKILTAAALAAGLMSGCSGSSSSSVKKVGIIQMMDHTSLNTIKKAYYSEMKTLGYNSKNIKYTYKNGQGNTNTLASIANEFQGEDLDAVVAIATPAAQAVAKLANKTPIIFSAVSDPVGAKLTSSLNKPDKNMTGTSDEVQVNQIIDKALEVQPKLKTMGLLYNKGEANSVTNIKNVKAYLKKKGIKTTEATVTKVSEVQSAMNVLASKCDAVFSPNDNTVASAMSVASKAANAQKIPFYVGADSMVKDGGFLTVGIDYEELGKETARMCDKVLKGTKVSSLPVKVFKSNLNIYVNQKTLKTLGLKLPAAITDDKKYIKM